MRRICIIAAAVATLAAGAVAYAGTTQNTYTAGFAFHENGTGSATKPVAVGFTQTYGAANAAAGMRAAPLTDIKLTIEGLKVDPGPFPTCSIAKILAAKSDAGCPKASIVATGSIVAALGDNTLQGPGTPCTPLLHVWNGGHGNLIFFFVVEGTHQCGGLQTGAAAPWIATVRNADGGMVENTPLPPDVSTDAGNIGAYGSLTSETLQWLKLTRKVHGKAIPFMESTGCRGGSRPYSVSFTATDAAGETLTGSASGKSKC